MLYILGIVVLLVLYVLSSFSPAVLFDYDKKDNQDYLRIGHRGAAGLAPENTLIAIEKGLEYKVDRIEIDVQQTKDGQVVLLHDLTVDRTTSGKGLVKDYTYAELAALDAGSWFDPAFKGEKVPTLEDAIRLINGRAELIIEIKEGNDYYPNIEENILEAIATTNSASWCIIHSFDTKVLESIHEKDPSIRLHKVFYGKLRHLPVLIGEDTEWYRLKNYPYIDEYSFNYKLANKGLIRKLKSKGKKVNVWTPNSQRAIDDMIGLGVDGVITDFPDKLD